MKQTAEKSQVLFVSHLYDLLDQAYRDGWALTSFLTPHQQTLAQTHLQNKAELSFWGGYPGAERKQLCIGGSADDIVCLHAAQQTTHPRVLGRLLHAGISRECIGDIVCTEKDMFLFCRARMAPVIADSLPFPAKEYLGPVPEQPDIQTVQVHCASTRLDAVVAALAHCSRKQAMEMLRMGRVKCNDFPVATPKPICNNDFVSIRNTGRFRLLEVKGPTKKGNLVLVFRKY